MENRVCKKCSKYLPEGYRYKCCEACRGKKIERIKKWSVKAVSIGGPMILAFVTKRKIDSHRQA